MGQQRASGRCVGKGRRRQAARVWADSERSAVGAPAASVMLDGADSVAPWADGQGWIAGIHGCNRAGLMAIVGYDALAKLILGRQAIIVRLQRLGHKFSKIAP